MTKDLKLLYKYLLKMNGKVDEVHMNDRGWYGIYGSYEQKFIGIRWTIKKLFRITLMPMKND